MNWKYKFFGITHAVHIDGDLILYIQRESEVEAKFVEHAYGKRGQKNMSTTPTRELINNSRVWKSPMQYSRILIKNASAICPGATTVRIHSSTSLPSSLPSTSAVGRRSTHLHIWTRPRALALYHWIQSYQAASYTFSLVVASSNSITPSFSLLRSLSVYILS